MANEDKIPFTYNTPQQLLAQYESPLQLLDMMFRGGEGGGGGRGDIITRLLQNPQLLKQLQGEPRRTPAELAEIYEAQTGAAIPVIQEYAKAGTGLTQTEGEQARLNAQEARRLRDPVGYAIKQREAATMSPLPTEQVGSSGMYETVGGMLTPLSPMQRFQTRNLSSVTPQERAKTAGMDATTAWDAIFRMRDEAEKARPKTYTT